MRLTVYDRHTMLLRLSKTVMFMTDRDTDKTAALSPFLIGRTVCSLNILRTVRQTIVRFLIERLLRRTWFGQFDELCFVLNWLIMRCKLRPELTRTRQHDPKCRLSWLKSNRVKSYTLIIPHRVIQITATSFWVPETRLRLP